MEPQVATAFFGRFSGLHPLQEAAIAPLLAGESVVLSAGTGSGKTEAVVAPLVSRFWRKAVAQERGFMLYVCPTKALINDIARRLIPTLSVLGLRMVVRHGDRDELHGKQPVHILATTPESLNVLMTRNDPFLLQIECVVLDEVHLLYNTQRGLQVRILIHRLRRLVGRPIQWAALSATIGKLEDVRSFLFGPEEPARLLTFAVTRPIDAEIRILAGPQAARDLIVRLMQLPRCKLLAFANTRRDCERCGESLVDVVELKGAVYTHYSSLSAAEREETERRFAQAPRAICAATSTLEMGIDIGDIDAVLLCGVPPGIESLLQRIGRGNRRAKKTNAICMVEDGPGAVANALRFSLLLTMARRGLMPTRQPERLYGAVCQQILSIVHEQQGCFTRIGEIVDAVSCRSDINRQSVEDILDVLVDNDLLKRHPAINRVGASQGLWDVVDQGLIWGNYPVATQTVDIRHGKHLLGSVPRANLMRLAKNTTFRFGGRRWRVTSADRDGVVVAPAVKSGTDVDVAYYGTAGPGMGAFIGRSLWDWLFVVSMDCSDMNRTTWARVEPVLTSIRSYCDRTAIPYARAANGGVEYFTFAGEMVNRILCRHWAGNSGYLASDISVCLPHTVDWRSVPRTPGDLVREAQASFKPSGGQTFFQQLLPLELQRREWMDSWLQDEDATTALGALGEARPVEVPSMLFVPFQDTE